MSVVSEWAAELASFDGGDEIAEASPSTVKCALLRDAIECVVLAGARSIESRS
jgi:hypothetical protein